MQSQSSSVMHKENKINLINCCERAMCVFKFFSFFFRSLYKNNFLLAKHKTQKNNLYLQSQNIWQFMDQ